MTRPSLSGVWNTRQPKLQTAKPAPEPETESADEHFDIVRILEAHERLLRAEMQARFLAEVERDMLRAVLDRLTDRFDQLLERLDRLEAPPPPPFPAALPEPVAPPAPVEPATAPGRRGGWSRPKSLGVCKCGEVFERHHPAKSRCDACKRRDHNERNLKANRKPKDIPS